ncbi:hypothetical protein FAVG1_12828 [Fusarium avenaceum]|nr:hypothetical protein FAVG1_12828 [Fusarium avenaceum]
MPSPTTQNNTPAIRSLHTLSITNGRFAVHPLLWTSQHLRLLDVSFREVDALDTTRLHVDRSKCRAETAKRMSFGNKYPFRVSTILVRRGSPLEAVKEQYGFHYNGRLVCNLHGKAFRIVKDMVMQKPEPIVGYYRYDADLQREKKFRPAYAPRGQHNDPGERLREHMIRKTTPDYWYHDPYLVCHLLSLADLQFRGWHEAKGNSQLPAIIPACLLVIHDSEPTHAYVFKADISSKVLQCLDSPTRSMKDAEFPIVSYTKVPFKPYATFSERIVLEIVGKAYASSFDRVSFSGARGKKRKFGERDEMAQRVSEPATP